MIWLQLIIWCGVNLATTVIGEIGNNNCPRFCKCDSYQQLNRAECSSRNLISAELDLPTQVQILDLSYNEITTIDNKCFGNFLHLKYLNLTHNAVNSIDWDTFFKLRRLREIDLSHNRLEYLDERLFIKNRYLNKVNLADNKFQTLENKPILRNPFVSVIILQNSQINSLQPQLFAGLSNLKYLDLSQNLLNTFNTEDFQHLAKLQELNLNNNFMECNKDIKSKIQHLQNKGINVSFKECESEIKMESQHQQRKFEKLVMSDKIKQEAEGDQNQSHLIQPWRFNLDSEEELIEEDNAEEKVSTNYGNNNEWLRFAPDAVLCEQKNIILCQEYRSCLQELSKTWHNQQQYGEQCSVNDIKFAFVMGIAIGVAAVIFILACALCLKKCLEAKKSVPNVIDIDSDHNLPNQPLARPTSQLPPQVRRQPRRRPARPARSLVRYEGPVAENFLSRLFGRPARQQYYRSINQNTATLIRRLSRSNLFTNRLSQHFVERQSSVEAANSPEIEDFPATAPRPETPPPSYGDVVVKNTNEGKD